MSTHTEFTQTEVPDAGANDVYATSVADEQASEGAHVFNAAGGDWNDLVPVATGDRVDGALGGLAGGC